MRKLAQKASAVAVTSILNAAQEKRAIALSDAMCGTRDIRTVLDTERAAVSVLVRDDLIAQRKKLSASQFRADCIALYGTTKAQEEMGEPKRAGRIVELFESHGYSKDVEKTLRADTKVIGEWFTSHWEIAQHALLNEKGRKVSHSDLAKLARKGLGRNAASGNGGRPAAEEPAKTETQSVTVGESVEQMIARHGIQTVLAACARILESDNKTKTSAKTINAIVEQIAA